MTEYFPTSTTSTTTVVEMAAGDSVYVAPDVTLIDSASSFTIFDASYGSAVIDGAVAGDAPLFFGGEAGETTDIEIGASGSVTDVAASSFAISVQGGSYDITNSGDIVAEQDSHGILVNAAGVIRNYGTIEATDFGVYNDDATPTDRAYLYNYGTIASSSIGVADMGGHAAFVYNYGTIIGGPGGSDAVFGDSATTEAVVNSGAIDGEVFLAGADSSVVNSGTIEGAVGLAGAESSLDSTHGSITGVISLGAGGGVVIAGQSGGMVIGSAGNDVLHANPTLKAADDAAETTLNGEGGNNWLYGDGAYTTFDSGAANGGINHIIGRLSKMSDVAGYANNTLSYATLAGPALSVDVNLLKGIANMCSAVDANTATTDEFTFEDYIRNVPNVIGSSGGDVIVCDNGVDQITGGGGGDTMYAGAGADSQDTFVYTAMTDSTQANEDVINGFKVGIDKIDVSALNVPPADIVLKYHGDGVSTVYVEQDPATGFNPATDLILSVHASTHKALTVSSILS